MNYEFIYTPYPDLKSALKDLEEKIKSIDFEPNLGIFFLVGDLINHYRDFSKLLNCNSICMPIEGFITPESIWMRGALLLLLDAKYDLYCFKGSTKKVCRGLSDLKKYDFYLLIYPVFYLSSRLHALNALIREKIYYRSYRKGNKLALEKASEFLEDNIVYPMNKVLRPIRDKGGTAIAFNLFPLKFSYGYPIALNGKNINRGLIAICFKEKIKSDYEDTLPERGKSFDETVEILKNELRALKVVEIDKRGVALGHVDGLKAVDFVLRERKAEIERDVKEDLNSGRFMPATPYGLCFISEETFGVSLLGILDYPLGIYPCLYDLDKFSIYALFIAYETIKGGIKDLSKLFRGKDFDFFAIDQNYILMYRENIVKIRELIGDSYGIFTTHPSYTSQSLPCRLMTEVEKGICINVTRNISFMKFQ